MSFLLFDVEFIGKVFKFHRVPFCSFQCSMLTVLTLLIQRKNPVNADFTEAKQKDRMLKISVVFRLL
jgi:hypothetical protein